MTTANKINGETLVLLGASKLQVTSFSNRPQYNKTVSGNFTALAAPLPSGSKPKNMQAGGLAYYYYEGIWDSLPDFKKLTPLQSGLAGKDFDIKKFPKQHNIACLLNGQLEIKTDGYYIFGIEAAGGAKLFVANQLLIDYNGIHSGDQFQSFLVPLVKGFYPMRIEYFQKDGNPLLNFGYITPEHSNPGAIPAELEYSIIKK